MVGDPFLREQKRKDLLQGIEKKTGSSMAHQLFRLEETPLNIPLAAARTLPFLSQGQVLDLHGADSLKEPDLALLAAYLANPAPHTFLILEADELRVGSELFQLAKTQGQTFVLSKEETRNAGAVFLQQKLGRFGKISTAGARVQLLEMCGGAMVFLDSMLDRLIQFSGSKAEINEEMVAQFEEDWTEMDVFQLTNAFLDRDPARILKVFRDLIDSYEADLVSLVGILHWQLRQLWQAAVFLEKGVSEREVCSRCKMPPRRLQVLKKIPLKTLEAALEALYQIDKKAKTGQVEGLAAVEAWLLQWGHTPILIEED